jgi:hypothetical protein
MDKLECITQIYECFNKIEQCIFDEKHTRNEKTVEEKYILLEIADCISKSHSLIEEYIKNKKVSG